MQLQRMRWPTKSQATERVSAATAFLHPARKRPNVHVHTHAHVTNIIFEGKRAVGVRYIKGGRGGVPVERSRR